MVVEIDVFVNQAFGLSESSNLSAVDALRFENGEEVLSQSIVIRIAAP